MQEATGLQSCLHCDLSFPVSRLPHHIRETHGDQKVMTCDDGETSSQDEEMEEDYYDESMQEDLAEDMDLEINDDDVNDYLKNLEESKQERAPEDSAASETQGEKEEETETIPCDICKLTFKKPDLANHLAIKHDIVIETDGGDVSGPPELPPLPIDGQLDESLEEDIVLKETCEMCDETVGIRSMISHLAEVHSVRVIMDPNRSLNSSMNSSLNSSLNSTRNEDPFDLPDFLKKDLNTDMVKFKCHHCQKAFLSVDKLDKHTAKKHEKRCKICHIQKLVQENRYRTILKQLGSAKVGDKRETPTNSSIATGEFFNKVFSYEELYPEMSLSCEECEDSFFWPDSSHSCPLVTQNIRVLSGTKVSRGRMVTGELDGSEGGDFDYISGSLAQSIVKKMALELVTEICSDVLVGVVELVVTGKYNFGVEIEKTNLQREALVLAEKFAERGLKIPDILNRAANESQFGGESGNALRKLLVVFIEEYKDDIEEQNKKMFNDRVEEKKRIQEEARKEMNQSKYFDYSKYAIPNLKAMKKSKPLLPLQRLNSSLDSSAADNIGDNNTSLPSGGTSLKATGSTTFLNKLKRQQNRTIKVYNKRSLLRTKPYAVPGPPGPTSPSSLGKAVVTLSSPSLSTQAAPTLSKNIPSILNTPSLSIKIEPGTLSSVGSDQIQKCTSSHGPLPANSSSVQPHSALRSLQPKSLPQSQKPSSQTPALNVRVTPSNLQSKSKSSVALERLQSLGLSVTVKERPPLQKPRPQNILPKPQSNIQVSTSLSKPQPPKLPIPRVGQPLSMKAKVLTQTQNTIFKNQGTKTSTSKQSTLQSSVVSKPVVIPPVPIKLTTSGFTKENIQQTGNQTRIQPTLPSRPSQLKTYVNKRKEANKTSTPKVKEIIKTDTPDSLKTKTTPVKQKVEFDEREKLMIKSQMLAYRMLRRNEALPEVVFNAATNKNFRNSSNHSKEDLSYLSSLFKKEYSNLKR